MASVSNDKFALPSAVLLGVGAGYLSVLLGYSWFVVGGIYGFAILPLTIIFAPDRGKWLVWQAGVFSYVVCVLIQISRSGAMGKIEALRFFFTLWIMESVISSPAPLVFYARKSSERRSRRIEWIFLGALCAGLIGFLFNAFLLVGLVFLWLLICFLRFACESRPRTEPSGARIATVVSSSALLLWVLASILAALSFKQIAFTSAMSNHYYWLARLFVATGADPNGVDRWGETALVHATWDGVGDPQGVGALIAMGADVNLERPSQFSGLLPSGTALHVASAAGRRQICESLLRAGADVNKKNAMGATPLWVALAGGSMDCVPTLLDHGADLNAKDTKGVTPLMLLMAFGPDDQRAQRLFQEMVARGVDFNARDSSGKTAQDWAIYFRHERFVDQLRSLNSGSQP